MKRKTNTFEKSCDIYFKDLNKYRPLSREEEFKLWKKYKKDNDIEARNKLITANLKYVVKVANFYLGRGLSYADLIAEGNMGLLKAIEKYDGNKGIKTLSYSIWWIKQTILEALNKRNELDGEDLPSDCEKCEIDSDENISNIDSKEGNDNFIDESTHNKDKEKKELISTLMNCLSKKEAFIITNYYGLDGNKPLTLEEIGKKLGITKERVRQINEKALIKLRSASLKNYSF